MEKTVSQLLQEARALVAAPGGWTQQVFHRFDPETGTHAYCTVGAVMEATDVRGPQWWAMKHEIARPALEALTAVLPAYCRAYGPSCWNEVKGRTQAEVVALFDAALTLVTK